MLGAMQKSKTATLGLRKKPSTVHYLYYRQINAIPSPTKICLKILRRLIESEDSIYRQIWKTSSQQPILCEDGKLYLNNYSKCLTLRGDNGFPSELYSLPQGGRFQRIVDAVVYSGPVYDLVNSEPECYKPFFVSLSADNWLRSYDNFTGKLLQEVYIGCPSKLKYQHCDWETYGKQLVLTSALNVVIRGETSARKKPRVLATLAVFTVLPLQFVALLEIDREIFGDNCNHVNVSEGMLVIGTGTTLSGALRLYDFTQVLQQSICETVRLGELSDSMNGAKVGTYPAGLPLNCKLKSPPTALFEVSCFDHIVHFGGYPWCYVTTPPRSEGVFNVRRVDDNNTVRNGFLQFPTTHFEPDTVLFHGDNSGRLLYKAAHAVKFFALEASKNDIELVEKNSFSFEGSSRTYDSEYESRRTRNFSRRASQNRLFTVSCSKSVLSDDFDEDTNLFAVLGYDPCDSQCEGRIILFDNVTGEKIKTIELGLKFDEMNDYSLTIELDNLIVIEKNECKKTTCYVYSLRRESSRKQSARKKSKI